MGVGLGVGVYRHFVLFYFYVISNYVNSYMYVLTLNK